MVLGVIEIFLATRYRFRSDKSLLRRERKKVRMAINQRGIKIELEKSTARQLDN